MNSSMDAPEKFRMINDAYEILSNYSSRNLYDLYLQGVPVKTELDEVTPRQRYKEAYIRDRIRKQRERIQQQIHYKQKFYRYFRAINAVCFIASLVYSVDYYYDSEVYSFPVEEVIDARYSTYVGFKNGFSVKTSEVFYDDYHKSEKKEVTVHLSAILNVPRDVKLSDSDKRYKINGTFFVFNNFFSIILFVCSIIVVGNKQYSDFRLTCGLLSCMTLTWLLLLTLPYL